MTTSELHVRTRRNRQRSWPVDRSSPSTSPALVSKTTMSLYIAGVPHTPATPPAPGFLSNARHTIGLLGFEGSSLSICPISWDRALCFSSLTPTYSIPCSSMVIVASTSSPVQKRNTRVGALPSLRPLRSQPCTRPDELAK